MSRRSGHPSFPDPDVERALRAFALSSGAAAAVRVSFRAGTAFLRGRVPSDTARRALEDLVRWHDGVEEVISDLRVVDDLP